MRFLFFLLLVVSNFQLLAQADSTSIYARSRVHARVGLGLFPFPEAPSAEISAAVGYGFSRYASLGVEYRQSGVANLGTSSGAGLFGLHLGMRAEQGLMAGVGLGFVVNASIGDDGFDRYEYFAGGQYMSTDWGYQFGSGITLGVYATIVQGQVFKIIEYNFDTDDYERTERTIDEQFFGGGIKLGYAFPRRSRR